MHCIQRLKESRVYESNNLITQFRHQRYARFTSVLRMLPSFSVACCYGFPLWRAVEFRIQAGMVLSAVEVGAGDSFSIFWHCATDRNRQRI